MDLPIFSLFCKKVKTNGRLCAYSGTLFNPLPTRLCVYSGTLVTNHRKQLKEAEKPVQSINAYSIKPPI